MFAILMLLCCVPVWAQFTIKEIRESDDEFTCTFPVLQSASQPEIARKINKILQMKELSLQITPTTKDPLSNLRSEATYTYNLASNNGRVFSLEIMTGHNGAGSHFQFRNYSFDARTGNPVNENTVFYPAAQVNVRQAFYKLWKESIKAHLKDDNFGEEYKRCLAEAETMTELPFDRMTITDSGFNFWGRGCLDGASWTADATIGPYTLSYDQLLADLTPDGLSLFIGAAPSAVAMQQSLIKGKIDNKYPITLTFTSSSDRGELKGIIVYDKFNTPITLTGTVTGNKVVFHEMNKDVAVSDIECIWDGKNLNGTFKNVKSGKVMSFEAVKI